MSATGIDHVGIVTAELPALAAGFERLGFTLTPLARHAGGRTGNRCIMLDGSYLELMAVLPGGASTTLQRFLSRHAGAHAAALAIDDAPAEQARLGRAGMTATVSDTERLADDADPGAARIRFTVVMPPDQPEGRLLLVRHHTPEALWQARWLRHPNQAVALTELVLSVADPAEAAARLSRLAGRPVVPDPLGGYALDLPRGRVRMLLPETAAGLLPGATLPAPPSMAGVTLRTGDANAAVRRVLRERGIAHVDADGAVVVEAGGAALRFVG